jgi:hypothetical protein
MAGWVPRIGAPGAGIRAAVAIGRPTAGHGTARGFARRTGCRSAGWATAAGGGGVAGVLPGRGGARGTGDQAAGLGASDGSAGCGQNSAPG